MFTEILNDLRLGFNGKISLKEDPDHVLDPIVKDELELEKQFMLELLKCSAQQYDWVADPFHLRISEFKNHEEDPAWEAILTNRDYDTRHELFRSKENHPLYTASLHQFYTGISLGEPKYSYCGHVNIELIMFGEEHPMTHDWHEDVRMKSLVCQTLVLYQTKVVVYYADWMTQYTNAPTLKSWQITALET